MIYSAEEITEDLQQQQMENPTFIEELIQTLDWENIAQVAIVASIRILLTLLIFFIVNIVAKWAINTVFKRFLSSRSHDQSRFETIYRVVKNVYRTIFYFFLIYTILEILNFPVGTLLASAGVVGLAISFGAQGFVSDLVNGFTILSGRQLSIGDEVQIEDISGTVIDLNLRTTEVKDFDGTIHYIPNREILVISNRSKGDMRAMIEVRLFPRTDMEKVRGIIEQVNEELVPEFTDITVPPGDISFVSNDKNQLTMRVIIYTKAGSQYGVQNKFYEAYVDALTEAGINIPYGDFELEKTAE